MAKPRTIGTIIVAAFIGLLTIFLVSPKQSKKGNKKVKKERSNLFI